MSNAEIAQLHIAAQYEADIASGLMLADDAASQELARIAYKKACMIYSLVEYINVYQEVGY